MRFVNTRRAHTLQSTCQPTITERSSPRTPNFNVAAISVAQLANSFPRKCPHAEWQNEDVNIEMWGRGGTTTTTPQCVSEMSGCSASCHLHAATCELISVTSPPDLVFPPFIYCVLCACVLVLWLCTRAWPLPWTMAPVSCSRPTRSQNKYITIHETIT